MKVRGMRMLLPVIFCALAAAVWADESTQRRRRVTPITTQATTTQAINETRDDTARINAQRRARSSHFHREDGATVWVDTITGEQWIDSTTILSVPKMKFPLLNGVSVSVDIWDPVMRLAGQKFGLIGFKADVNLHNRYFPAFEAGLGHANSSPSGMNFTYKSPLSIYFKLGADYNFLYNSNPDYKWFAGLRYGFSPFSWQVTDITMPPGYWGPTPSFAIPSQRSTVGWMEFNLGLQVRLWRNLSAGWRVLFHGIIHQTKNIHGQPWYIPGYGSRNGIISGSFSLTYTLPLGKGRTDAAADTVPGTGTLPQSLDFPVEEPADTLFNQVMPSVVDSI